MLKGLDGQILEMLLLAVILCCILIGSNRGLIISLYSMVKYLIVIAAAVGIAPVIAKRLPDSLAARDGIGYVIALLIAMIVFNIVGRLIKVVNDIPIVSGINKLGGAFFGLICGFLVVWTVLTLLGVFQDYEWCRDIAGSARKNDVVMWFQNCNPIPLVLKRFGFAVL